MPKKNRKQERAAKLFEKTEIESAEVHPEKTDADKNVHVESSPELIEQQGTTFDPERTDVLDSAQSSSHEDDSSTDALLDDVRQSLIEDQTLQENKKSKKWWRRVAKSLQKDKGAETASTPTEENSSAPVTMETEATEERAEEINSEVDEIDELINILEREADEIRATAPIPAETAALIEPKIDADIEELKKQAFRPRSEDVTQDSITEVRSVALEDGEEVFVEVQSTHQDPLEERLTAVENALRPYRSYIYFGFTVLGVILALIASAVLYNAYRQSRPAAPTVVSNLPFPTSISLPGGLNFSLGKGSLTAGEWDPRGPEWLEGTEICRWVAIPWSTQIEAVIRTLNADDPIELTMSNNDRLVYKVYSIQQLSNEELHDLPSDSPCLLLVLAKADSETRWVLTALP